MPRLPDRFDLWVRRAREMSDAARQADLILGALVARQELHFLNAGSASRPVIAQTEIGDAPGVLVFSDAGRVEDFVEEHPGVRTAASGPAAVISTPAAAALQWCVERGCGVVINPRQEDTVFVPGGTLAVFVEDWLQRRDKRATGYWIPNMTNEEEDFWQEHGL